jgi:hypothetical protein
MFYCSPSTAQQSDLEVGLYNIGINGLIGGIGAVINKEKEEPLGKVILKGIGQGAMGGYLIFESKRLVREFSRSENYIYVWPSKLVNAAGSSIVENAAANHDFWEKWYLTIGFTRLEIDVTENFRLSYRINPIALIGTIITSTEGKLDVQKTVKTGSFVFTSENLESEFGFNYGRTSMMGNTILLLDTWEGDMALSHEIIHTYQNENFKAFNPYFDKPLNSLFGEEKIYRQYNRFFYTDVSSLISLLFYNAAGTGEDGYGKNLFEKEAFYFSSSTFQNPEPPILH